MFHDRYKNRRVLVTGHSGFLGSWLVAWLERLEARICGVALRPIFEPNHFRLLQPEIQSEWADIRESAELMSIFEDFRPEIVFHLAAQSLEGVAREDPAGTFATNIAGTVNVLEACRRTGSVRAVIAAGGGQHGEGGLDPYNASKNCALLAVDAYRHTFFSADVSDGILLAAVRMGNVIGGGDWSADRLVPELVRAALQHRPYRLRQPGAACPWLHVLEPLAGCLELGRRLFEGDRQCAANWNFGPEDSAALSVLRTAEFLRGVWPRLEYTVPEGGVVPEPLPPRPGSDETRRRLEWRCLWNTPTALERTAVWYRDFHEENRLNTAADLDAYFQCAEAAGIGWFR